MPNEKQNRQIIDAFLTEEQKEEMKKRDDIIRKAFGEARPFEMFPTMKHKYDAYIESQKNGRDI